MLPKRHNDDDNNKNVRVRVPPWLHVQYVEVACSPRVVVENPPGTFLFPCSPKSRKVHGLIRVAKIIRRCKCEW